MKFILNISICFLLLLILGCKNNIDYLEKYKKPSKRISDVLKEDKGYDLLYKKNSINLKNGYPFYVITKNAILLLSHPMNNSTIPNNYIPLKFGDILFPVKEYNPENKYFYVRTIDNIYGWIHSSFGISLDTSEDPDLYFFSNNYYLKRYIDAKGNIDNSNLVILIKNIVPMLLDNFQTEGWFYPSNYELALDISLFGVTIAKDQDTLFHSASSYDWSVNEVVVAKNLLADCYHKLKEYDKAIEIHEKLLKNQYFWKRSDNSQIGGLNSVVKLVKLYLDKLKMTRIGTREYNTLRDRIVELILIPGDNYSHFGIFDKKWKLTASEWLLDILKNSVSTEEFYTFCNMLEKKTISDGFSDLILVYRALALYKEGKQKEALDIFSSLKPKKNFTHSLNIDDWLKENQIVPDSIIYQYDF